MAGDPSRSSYARLEEGLVATYDWLDARFDLERARGYLGKAFPAEDSFLLGEIALFCFVVLVLTGTFLGVFFEPSTSEVTYEGSVAKYQGQDLPASYVSVLNITYDVPYGMFLRRMHHWAAHLFVAAIALHMLRVFFTGAYRNPREPNWVVGSMLAVLSMFAAYTGYSLPFDEFASTATGIGYSIAKSIPIVGDLFSKVVFGGAYPSSATIPRFYFLHVFLIPAAIAILIGVHMAILLRQKHTEAPREDDVPGPGGEGLSDHGDDPDGSTPTPAGDGAGAARRTGSGVAAGPVARDDDTFVRGLPAFPNQVAVSAVVFFLTMATLSVLAGFLPVHNVAEYGPNDPASTPSLIMPDWFLMWVFGFLKLIPPWLSFTIPIVDAPVTPEFIGGMVFPGIVFALVFAWPFIDRHDGQVHFTANPLERPVPTAVGVAAVQFVMVASIAGMNNQLADLIAVSTGRINAVLTWAIVLVPAASGWATYRLLDGNAPAPPDERAEGNAPEGASETAPPDEASGDGSSGDETPGDGAPADDGGEAP